MFLLKTCPKCGGDVCLERDEFDAGVNLVCFQCGYYLRGTERAAVLARLRRSRQPAAGRQTA